MKQELKGLKACGEKIEATLLYLGEESIVGEKINQEVNGKIIVGLSIDRSALNKAHALDAAGLVVSEISDELFSNLEKGKSWEIGEVCCFRLPTLVVDKETLLLLKELSGHKTILDPQSLSLSCL